MFWYDLPLLISSVANKVRALNIQPKISSQMIESLADILIEMSVYSTAHGGDITKRNFEALGDLVLCFHSPSFVTLVRKYAGAYNNPRVKRFIQSILKRVAECRRDAKKGDGYGQGGGTGAEALSGDR